MKQLYGEIFRLRVYTAIDKEVYASSIEACDVYRIHQSQLQLSDIILVNI